MRFVAAVLAIIWSSAASFSINAIDWKSASLVNQQVQINGINAVALHAIPVSMENDAKGLHIKLDVQESGLLDLKSKLDFINIKKENDIDSKLYVSGMESTKYITISNQSHKALTVIGNKLESSLDIKSQIINLKKVDLAAKGILIESESESRGFIHIADSNFLLQEDPLRISGKANFIGVNKLWFSKMPKIDADNPKAYLINIDDDQILNVEKILELHFTTRSFELKNVEIFNHHLSLDDKIHIFCEEYVKDKKWFQPYVTNNKITLQESDIKFEALFPEDELKKKPQISQDISAFMQKNMGAEIDDALGKILTKQNAFNPQEPVDAIAINTLTSKAINHRLVHNHDLLIIDNLLSQGNSMKYNISSYRDHRMFARLLVQENIAIGMQIFDNSILQDSYTTRHNHYTNSLTIFSSYNSSYGTCDVGLMYGYSRHLTDPNITQSIHNIMFYSSLGKKIQISEYVAIIPNVSVKYLYTPFKIVGYKHDIFGDIIINHSAHDIFASFGGAIDLLIPIKGTHLQLYGTKNWNILQNTYFNVKLFNENFSDSNRDLQIHDMNFGIKVLFYESLFGLGVEYVGSVRNFSFQMDIINFYEIIFGRMRNR
jgi:hypothetical protein